MNNFDNYVEIDHISRTDFLSRVFTYLGLGLGLSAVGAYAGQYLLPLMGSAYMFGMLTLVIAEMVLAFMIGHDLERRDTATVRMMFIFYSLINGMTLSVVLAVYTAASVLFAFVTTAIVFGCMAIIGKTTKLDLSRFGTLFFTGMIACIVLSLANLFIFHASGMEIALCYIETILFLGLIAYDMQMIDRYYSQAENENYAIFAALQLELDFINLMLRVLRFFGVRKNDN